jgi:stage III sporulation protein AB
VTALLVKVLGVFLALLSGSLAGAQWSSGLARRVRELSEFRSALLVLETEISYVLMPLPEACAVASARAPGTVTRHFFERVGGLIAGERLTAAHAWAIAVDECQRLSYLWPADWDPLRRLGQVVGVSGREEQLKHLAQARETLSDLEEVAALRSAQLGKLYRYSGPAAAVLAVLLFL